MADERKSARQFVYERLVGWILDGTLAPGEQIAIDELTEFLGVSRTPVREALQMAEQQLLVDVLPGRLTRVCQASPDSWEDVAGPLSAMEVLAAERAAPLITRMQLARLSAVNDAIADSTAKGYHDQSDMLDDEFHAIIVESSGYRIIVGAIATLKLHRRRLVRLFFRELGPNLDSAAQHEAIIIALEHGDGEAAGRAVAANWSAAGARLASSFSPAPKTVPLLTSTGIHAHTRAKEKVRT